MRLIWGENLSVGNDVTDTEHQYFVESINRVESCLALKDLHPAPAERAGCLGHAQPDPALHLSSPAGTPRARRQLSRYMARIRLRQ